MPCAPCPSPTCAAPTASARSSSPSRGRGTSQLQPIVNGLANARELLRRIDAGEVSYHLIEVMSCQGGCVGGAGQPYGLTAAKRKRGAGLYESDSTALFKRAEKNPIVTNLLAEYGEERCHELLHVSYL